MLPRVLIVAALLFTPAAADAQATAPRPAPTVVPMTDLTEDLSWMDWLDLLWTQFSEAVGLSASLEARELTSEVAQRLQQRDEFVWMMNIAGYKLKEIESAIGLVPGLSLTFAQARELTEADREYVERQLERHAMRYGWPLAILRRAIVRSVLEASELGKYAVAKVEVDLLPLPKVKLVLAPVDAPLSEESSRLMRAIERLGEMLREQRSAAR